MKIMIETNQRMLVQHWAVQVGPCLVAVLLPLFFYSLDNWNLEFTRVSLFLVIVSTMLVTHAVFRAVGLLSEPSLDRIHHSFGMGVAPLLVTNPLAAPVLAYGLAYLLSTLFSIAPNVSWLGTGNGHGMIAVIGCLLFFLLSASAFQTWQDLDRLITGLLLSSVAVSFYGLLQYIGLDPFPWVTAATSPVGSTLGLPGLCGAYLTMVMFFALARMIGQREVSPRLSPTYAVIFLLQLACLVFTLDRAAILGGVGGMAVFGWLASDRWPQTRRIVLLITILVSGALLIILINWWGTLLLPAHRATVAELGQIRENSNTVRVILWRSVLGLISARLPLGYGPETFQHVYGQEFAPLFSGLGESVPTDPYNSIIHELFSTGIVGLLAFLWVLLTFYRVILSRRRHIPETYHRLVVAACCASTASYLTQAQFHPDAIVLTSLLWLVFAVGMAAVRPPTGE